MKQFSKIAIIATCILIISLYNFTAKGQSANNFSLSFTSTPTLLSGNNLAIGATYKFTNVANNTYAIVTIIGATGGATVEILDDNNLTKPEAFSPRIVVPASSNGIVEFNIAFYNAQTNATKSLDTLSVTAMDIDGSGSLHEQDALNLGANSALSYQTSTLEINVTQNGNEFLGVNVAGVEYTAVDTAAKQVMYTVANGQISNFTYKAGVNNEYTGAVSRQKGIYFKAFTYPVLNTLPVQLLLFTATANNKNITLNWLTQNEINSKYFELERSYNGTDFKNIAIVLDGLENGNKKTYAYKDVDAINSQTTVVYYRLKQIDVDGKFTYSHVITVKITATNNTAMQVMPNPFAEHLQIQYTAAQQSLATIQLVGTNGKVVYTKNISMAKGFNSFTVSGLSNLPSAMYIATLSINNSIVATQKIIK